jgi:hypothetical protein
MTGVMKSNPISVRKCGGGGGGGGGDEGTHVCLKRRRMVIVWRERKEVSKEGKG